MGKLLLALACVAVVVAGAHVHGAAAHALGDPTNVVQGLVARVLDPTYVRRPFL